MARGTVLQWMVARALCEGAPATEGRVAALMGVDVSVVSARASAEDWARAPEAPVAPLDGADPVAVLAGASAFVARQVAALIERAEHSGGRLDKEQVDGLAAFGRMMERWEALAKERVQEEETTSDEDLETYIRDVNERIVTLAALEARRLAAAGFRAEDDA